MMSEFQFCHEFGGNECQSSGNLSALRLVPTILMSFVFSLLRGFVNLVGDSSQLPDSIEMRIFPLSDGRQIRTATRIASRIVMSFGCNRRIAAEEGLIERKSATRIEQDTDVLLLRSLFPS